eukprot:m.198535 g.198535  ORF g.198535 m.198535 type:complete len:233 (-) comp25141_c0_seq1:125-823(-)
MAPPGGLHRHDRQDVCTVHQRCVHSVAARGARSCPGARAQPRGQCRARAGRLQRRPKLRRHCARGRGADGPTTSENGWTHTLVQARPAHQTSALHVDLHGMARVGTTECILGLGAMRAVDPQRADQFHAALVHRVATLPLFGGNGTGLIVGKPGDRLQGCWGKKLQRCSLTQQACTAAAFPAGSRPYTHAVQVEMTMDLRKRLVHNHDEAEAFATALVMAFRSCCAEAGVPS